MVNKDKGYIVKIGGIFEMKETLRKTIYNQYFIEK